MSALSYDFVLKAIENSLENQKCHQVHPGLSCNQKSLHQFFAGSRSIMKMYLLVHLVPFLLFKRKKTKQNPAHQIKKLVTAFIKSILFAGGYTMLVRRIVCFWAKFHKFQGKANGIAAIFASATLMFEPISRQSQIALFCLNKSMETSYNMLIRRKYPIHVPYGEGILGAIALAIIAYHYINNQESIKGNYLKFLDKLLKDC